MRQLAPRDNNGSIILRFTYLNERYSFNPVPGGKFSDKLVQAKAKEIASQIYQDCITGHFDSTLVKYKPNSQKISPNFVKEEIINVIDLLTLFKEYTEFKSKTLKSNSMVDYRHIQNKLAKCPYKLVRESVAIIQWLVNDHKGTSTSSVSKQWMLINACCKWGVACQKIQSNPFDGLRKLIPITKNSGAKEEINPFSLNERERIITAFKSHKHYCHYAPLVEFLFITGCRPEEALALQWKHIKGSKITFCQKLTISGEIEAGLKTQEKRSITMNDRIQSVVNSVKRDDCLPNDFIFPAKNGGLLIWCNFGCGAWRSILESLPDIQYRNPYQMRHTCITLMIRSGADSTMVAKWVGNSPNIIAKRYLGDVSDVVMPVT